MTKREIKSIIKLHKSGVGLDTCYSAIIQQCIKNISRSELNSLVDALNYFRDNLYPAMIVFESNCLTAEEITAITPGKGDFKC